MMEPPHVVRIRRATLPDEWKLSPDGTYTQLSLQMCNLSRVPDLKDGRGRFKKPAKEPQSITMPLDLELDEVDRDADGRARAVRAQFAEAAAAKAEADKQMELDLQRKAADATIPPLAMTTVATP